MIKSQILKEDTNCNPNDFNCIYWQTSYQFSDTQIACYTPTIPPEDRFKLFYASNDLKYTNGQIISWMYLSLEVDGGILNIACTDNRYCSVYYTLDVTGYLETFEPANFYIGSLLNLRLNPKYNTVEQIDIFKIDNNNCVPIIPDGFDFNYGDNFIQCDPGTTTSIISNEIKHMELNFMWGLLSVHSFRTYCDIDPTLSNIGSCYYFRVYSKIDSISSNVGTTNGGQQITITGKGFGSSSSTTQVYINEDECVDNLQITNYQISCKTPQSTINFSAVNSNTLFFGSHGLRWRVYTGVVTYNNLISLPNFPNSNNLVKDDVILELSTPQTSDTYFSQYMNGYFKALYSGNYRFWSTSDDGNRLYLSTDLTKANLTNLINFSGYTVYDDYITQYSNTRSDWVHLTAGNLYYMEAYHFQFAGPFHYRLGVEIDYDETPVASYPLLNQINRILEVTLLPKISRDLYEIPIPDLGTFNYTLTCKNKYLNATITNRINANFTSTQMRLLLSTILGDNRIIVRKIEETVDGYYYLADNTYFDNSSYTSAYSFDYFDFLNGTSTPQQFQTVDSGVLAGTSYLFYFDETAPSATYKWDLNCYFTKVGSNNIIGLNHLQSVSPLINGVFSFTITDQTTGNQYNSNLIQLTNSQNPDIIDPLSQVPPLINNIEVFNANTGNETVNFFILLGTYDNIQITVNENILSGGYDGTPTIIIEEFLEKNTTLFFYPIPADFLYLNSIINI